MREWLGYIRTYGSCTIIDWRCMDFWFVSCRRAKLPVGRTSPRRSATSLHSRLIPDPSLSFSHRSVYGMTIEVIEQLTQDVPRRENGGWGKSRLSMQPPSEMVVQIPLHFDASFATTTTHRYPFRSSLVSLVLSEIELRAALARRVLNL